MSESEIPGVIFLLLIILCFFLSNLLSKSERFERFSEIVAFLPIILLSLGALMVMGILFFAFFGGTIDGGEYKHHYDEEQKYSDEDPGVHWVDDYERTDGTKVDGHWRSNPDDNPYNNLNH